MSEPGVNAIRGDRLRVELRVCALVGLVAELACLHAAIWLWVVSDTREFNEIPWARLSMAPMLAVLIALLVAYGRLPATRWPRSASTGAAPLGLSLLLGGALGLVLAPLLVIRDRRVRARQTTTTPDEVELAFRELTLAPGYIGNALGIGLAAAMVANAVMVGGALDWGTGRTAALATLWAAILAPLAAITASRVRAILRPELLAAPRPRTHTATPPPGRGLRTVLFLPAIAAALGATVAPLVAAWLFSASAATWRAELESRGQARQLIESAQSNEIDELEAYVQAHDDATITTGVHVYGRVPQRLPKQPGPFDRDGDGANDSWAEVGGITTAIVPLNRVAPIDWRVLILAAVGLLGLAACAAWIITRDFERDTARATELIIAVTSGVDPPEIAESTLFSREIRRIVAAVGRLLERITEANVAKYVAIERAQEADRLKSQFLANMSHDLRSPLNSILGFSELLLSGIDGELDEGKCELIRTIEDSGRQLLQQIDDILDTAKLEAGRMELQPEPTPPSTLISRAITGARKRLAPSLHIDSTIEPGLPPAFVDPYRTAQAIEHVMVFAAEGSTSGNVTVACARLPADEAPNPMLTITVTTQTPAPTQAELDAVLGGFHRVAGRRGLGLGLPIAGSICELQGGSLTIVATPQGAQYVLRLPVPQARKPKILRLSSDPS